MLAACNECKRIVFLSAVYAYIAHSIIYNRRNTNQYHTLVELTQRFGGVTAYSRSPATGLWKRTEADVERGQVIMIEVVVEALDREWWAQYRGKLEQRFGQEEVHARALPIERI